jgi:hypothetical protein
MQRILITLGLILLATGLLYPQIQKLGLGRLPGDISVEGERYALHFPLVTCLILSAALSGVLWLVRRFF